MRKNYRHNEAQSPVTSAHAAGKAAAADRDFALALEYYKTALDAGGLIRIELLQDVLALGKPGKDELRRRRDTIESDICGTGTSSVDEWQALNLALREPDHDLKLADAVLKKGIEPSNVLLLESVIRRLMKNGNRRRALRYVKPLSEFLHASCQTAGVYGVSGDLKPRISGVL